MSDTHSDPAGYPCIASLDTPVVIVVVIVVVVVVVMVVLVAVSTLPYILNEF